MAGRSWLLPLLASVLLLRSLSFVGFFSSTSPARKPSASAPASSRVALQAEEEDLPTFSWDADGPPPLPESPEEMAQQAADAVMRAYRDGKTRQTVRLRLDELFDMESLYVKGIQALQMATTPFMEGLSKKLWGGDFFKDVKTSVVDDQAGTLIYRESDNEMQDMAMFYLPGRDLMAEQKTQNFIRRMKDRLVLLVNTENAQSFFRVDFKGMDWGDYTNMGKEISNIFQEQTYYYDKAPCQSWQMTTFRAYPYNWEVYIEDLDYNLVKVWDSEYKPTTNQIEARLEQYEKVNGIEGKAYKKMAKIMKDTMKQEEMSEEIAPGWRSAASPEEMVERQKLAEERRFPNTAGRCDPTRRVIRAKSSTRAAVEPMDFMTGRARFKEPGAKNATEPRSEAWPPGSDEEEPDFEASARQSLQLQCQELSESLTRLRQEIADAGTREQRLKELLRCRSRSLVRLASQLTRAQDQRRPTDRGLFHVEVQTEVPTLDAIDPEAALPTVTSRPAQRVVELAASSPAVRDMVLQRLKGEAREGFPTQTEDFLNLCQFAVATQKWGHTAQRCNAQSFESRHATPVLAPPWLMLAPHVVGAAAAGRRFPVGRRAFAAVPVPEVLRRLRWLHSPGQVLRLAAKNEGADMVVLCALLQRLVYLAKQDGGSKETELSQDGRFQVLLKTLSSRVESCDGGTLARLADAAARLPRSAEVEELMQRLVESAVGRHNAIKPQDLSFLAVALATARVRGVPAGHAAGHAAPLGKAVHFVRGEALRQMQEFKWNSCIRLLEAFRRWGIVDPNLTEMVLARLQDILPDATTRDLTMLLEYLCQMGLACLELLQPLCQMAFSSLWLFTPQQLVSIAHSLARLRFLSPKDLEELLEALLPHVGRLSDPEVSRLLFALALSNPDWQGKWQTVKQVLAAQYVAGSTRNLRADVSVAWAFAVLQLPQYMPDVLRLLDTHATSAVDVPRSVLVMLHEVCSYVACHGLHSELAVQWRSAAEETNKEEVERWARSGSPLRAQVHRALMPDPGFQGPVAWLCGFSVDFLNQRSKTVIDLDHISWPTSPTLRHLLLKEKGYRTDARPVGCEDLTDGRPQRA
ncbi:unnamed protein product [Durusdinium trenchii]|uniref:Uncharacterized protein n=1 Tax=Durusdinium trenchii TaxID=1381693 RepID=A0ABP0QWQ6_9DINO